MSNINDNNVVSQAFHTNGINIRGIDLQSLNVGDIPAVLNDGKLLDDPKQEINVVGCEEKMCSNSNDFQNMIMNAVLTGGGLDVSNLNITSSALGNAIGASMTNNVSIGSSVSTNSLNDNTGNKLGLSMLNNANDNIVKPSDFMVRRDYGNAMMTMNTMNQNNNGDCSININIGNESTTNLLVHVDNTLPVESFTSINETKLNARVTQEPILKTENTIPVSQKQNERWETFKKTIMDLEPQKAENFTKDFKNFCNSFMFPYSTLTSNYKPNGKIIFNCKFGGRTYKDKETGENHTKIKCGCNSQIIFITDGTNVFFHKFKGEHNHSIDHNFLTEQVKNFLTEEQKEKIKLYTESGFSSSQIRKELNLDCCDKNVLYRIRRPILLKKNNKITKPIVPPLVTHGDHNKDQMK